MTKVRPPNPRDAIAEIIAANIRDYDGRREHDAKDQVEPDATLLIIAESFALHCSRCGRAWSMPTGGEDFEARQRVLIDWYRAHPCEESAMHAVSGSPLPPTEKEA